MPLPVYLVNSFPPWEGLTDASVDAAPDRGLGDLVTDTYPMRVFAAESLKAYHLPVWNPLILGGTPFIARMHSRPSSNRRIIPVYWTSVPPTGFVPAA